jgi:hypothetical protein
VSEHKTVDDTSNAIDLLADAAEFAESKGDTTTAAIHTLSGTLVTIAGILQLINLRLIDIKKAIRKEKS